MTKILFKKSAFTLAEVLITLGIIGVVAALTIPGLMTAYNKHIVETKVSKSYSTLNQFVKLAQEEYGEMSTWDKDMSGEEYIKHYITPFMKVQVLCKDFKQCGFPTNSDSQWRYMRGGFGSYANPKYSGRIPFYGMDGVLYTFSRAKAGMHAVDNDKTLIIDINGGKMPNTFGKDVFFFYRLEDENVVVPYCYNKSTDYINKDCSKKGVGLCCAMLLKQNGWKVPRNYPLQ